MAISMPTQLTPGTVLVLPDTENTGTVVEIADSTNLRVGDIVLFNKEPIIEVNIGDITHRLIQDHNVLGWYYRAPLPEPIPL